jgi:hypothetical protein
VWRAQLPRVLEFLPLGESLAHPLRPAPPAAAAAADSASAEVSAPPAVVPYDVAASQPALEHFGLPRELLMTDFAKMTRCVKLSPVTEG